MAVTEELSSPMEASSSCASAVCILLDTADFPGFAAARPAVVAALLPLSVWPPAFEAAPGARLPGWAVAPLPDLAAGLLPGLARWASSLDQMLPARLGCISCRNSASWGSSAWQVCSMKVLRIGIPQTFCWKNGAQVTKISRLPGTASLKLALTVHTIAFATNTETLTPMLNRHYRSHSDDDDDSCRCPLRMVPVNGQTRDWHLLPGAALCAPS